MKKLEEDLAKLRRKVIEMGNLTEQMVSKAIQSIDDNNRDALIADVVEAEDQLDHMQLDIDKEAIRLLTVYSPVAADLRFVMSVSRITAELERIGDHATNMCESVQLMVGKAITEVEPEVQQMATIVCEMVTDALNAFLHGDHRRARATIVKDDLVDTLNDQIVKELLSDQLMKEVLEGQRDVAGALSQMLLARSLERIADQATNISEEVVYMVKGRDIRHDVNTDDQDSD
ncbi:MAG: phosphate signaling complex protein PhoU [Planctomycetales bacterium]|nr:phosphate signaling complex protein PhoU [Planctomycetales bacterium]